MIPRLCLTGLGFLLSAAAAGLVFVFSDWDTGLQSFGGYFAGSLIVVWVMEPILHGWRL